jgi:hypothetical protein
MATELGAPDQDRLHFFAALEELLACPDFLPDGKALKH